MKQMAFPKSRPSPWSRLAAIGLSAGIGYIALHCFVAGLRGPEYGYFLFGLLFAALAGIALNVGTRE